MQRLAHVRCEFQSERIALAVGFGFVPAHDRLVAQSEVAAVEPHVAFAQPALCVLHGPLPLGGGDGVAGAEAIGRAKPCLSGFTDLKMKACKMS